MGLESPVPVPGPGRQQPKLVTAGWAPHSFSPTLLLGHSSLGELWSLRTGWGTFLALGCVGLGCAALVESCWLQSPGRHHGSVQCCAVQCCLAARLCYSGFISLRLSQTTGSSSGCWALLSASSRQVSRPWRAGSRQQGGQGWGGLACLSWSPRGQSLL